MVSSKRSFLPLLLVLAAACGKLPDAGGPDAVRDSRIPAAQAPLYGDLSAYELVPGAQTRTDGPSVTLGSLLVPEKARTVRFEGISFTQIPLQEDGTRAEYGRDLVPAAGAATAVRKFYVETAQDGTRYRYIVTMVAEAQYAGNHPDFDYLDMANFTGAVLLSTPDGKVFRAERYENGLTREALLLRQQEVAGKSDLRYIKRYRQPADSRASDPEGWELASAVCLAAKPDGTSEILTSGDALLRMTGAQGAGIIPHPQYTVSITTNLPDYVDVKGCGTYSSGSWATLGCFPAHPFLSLDFGRWTGAFAGEKRPWFPWKVTHDILATAWYDDSGPCVDLDRGVANPLKQMSVAATGSGSYVNGTFKALRGWYEDGTPRYHWGIDLYARPGTPVYSMYDGTVLRTETDHPDRYEEKSFGNVIVTENEVKGYGGKLYLQYSHLQFGRPVAENPRTGKPFARGDRVFAGDLIGYTGKTGNAFDDTDVPNKHLDLMAASEADPATGKLKSAALLDPAPFLNGTIDLDNLQRQKGKVGHIRCD